MRPERRFLFRLALALGMTVGRLLCELTSEELTEWMGYDRIDPFGSERSDLRSAIVASTIAATQGSQTAPSAFMPDFRTEAEKSDERVEKMKRQMMAWSLQKSK